MSDSGLDKAGQLINANSRTLAPEAVGSQVLLMTVVSITTIFLFNVLRPKNKIIYEPKVKYHVGDKPPPSISNSLFGWLPPVLHTKEPELVDKIGLDAAAFLRFLRLMRWLFTGVAILTCGILIPINVTFNLKNVDPHARDLLSMLTIRDVGGAWLYVHVFVTYAITILIVFTVYVHWREMVRLRHQWFRSPEYLQLFHARTLTVLHVPRKYQSDEGIKSIFDSVKVPYPTTSVHIGRKVGSLPELIEYHNTTVRELEAVLVRYLKGGRIGKNRPMIRAGGWCGLGGTKKDAIEFYTAKLKRTEAAIEEYRAQINTHKAENYGFASMAAVPYAHIVAKMLSGKHPNGTDIALAPHPKDIIWENMNKSDAAIVRKKMMGFMWLVLVCFFNTLPLFVISVLANLNALASYVPILDGWSQASPGTFAVVSGVLPPAVSALFGFFLPIIMRWLSQYMGALTHSKLDRVVVARYFTFLVISQLVIFTLIGVIFNSIQEIVAQAGKKTLKDILDNLHTLPDKINRTYINQASYWLTFFPLRGFLAIFDLAQIINLLWLSFKTHVFGRTIRDIREWTQPPEFQYAIYYSNMLFMGAVALVFAPLAPLVALAAMVVFWVSSWVYKYQLMFVYVSKVESGGRLWNVVINRLLVCVFLMQALMTLTIGLQHEFKSLQWISTLPPILIVIAFKVYINHTFDPAFRYFNPTEQELRMAKIHSERADNTGHRLEKRFGHPALNADLFTPMLHAKMMPLLSQVYKGKINRDEAKLNEYGGQKMEAQVVEGIRIAAIDQRDLEYDPSLYRRNRELDWDSRSMTSTHILSNENAPLYPRSKSPFFASDTTLPAGSRPSGYDRYLAKGPQTHQDIELAPIDSQNEPLLSARSQTFYQQTLASQQTLVPTPTHRYQDSGPREAPIHRPYPSQGQGGSGGYLGEQSPPYSVEPQFQQPPGLQQQYSHHQQASQYSQQHSRQGSNSNVAGRGAYRG